MVNHNIANLNGLSLIPNVVLRSAFNSPNLLNIIHLSICSFLPKLDILKAFIAKANVDILLISETWLDPSIDSHMIRIAGYKLYRCDRSLLYSFGNLVKGGGVAMFVRCGISVKVLGHSSGMDQIEFLFAQININKAPILLGVVYFPHPAAFKLNPLLKFLDNFASNFENILIGGDFNVDLLDDSDCLKHVLLEKL